MKRLAIIALFFGVILQVHSQGNIVPNGIAFLGFDGLGYEIHVSQNSYNSDYTGFVIEPIGKTPPSSVYTNTFSFGIFLDEGVRVFVVPLNAAISLQTILAQSYPELTFANSHVFNSGASFYLGFYTGYNPFAITNIDGHTTSYYTGIYTDPVFGWAKFRNNEGAIQFLDSALESGGGGIYAGTQNIIPVPEPGSLPLIGIGALLLSFFHRRNSSR